MNVNSMHVHYNTQYSSPPKLADYALSTKKFDFGWQLMFLVPYFANSNTII